MRDTNAKQCERKLPSIHLARPSETVGQTDEQPAPAHDFQREAQFYVDFIEAENSMGFHAPQGAARILGESIDFTRRGQKELRK